MKQTCPGCRPRCLVIGLYAALNITFDNIIEIEIFIASSISSHRMMMILTRLASLSVEDRPILHHIVHEFGRK